MDGDKPGTGYTGIQIWGTPRGVYSTCTVHACPVHAPRCGPITADSRGGGPGPGPDPGRSKGRVLCFASPRRRKEGQRNIHAPGAEGGERRADLAWW